MLTLKEKLELEQCQYKYIASNGKDIRTCSDLYNCCDCGGNNCGCAYCFSCHACEHCQTQE